MSHMPVDQRGRRIAVVCHCLLNANSKVEGLAQYPGIHPIVERLAGLGIGVVQMPCAEMMALGMRRWGQTREQYENPAFVSLCECLAAETAAQLAEFIRCGYEIVGLVGVDGSPTCGVHRSASGDWGGECPPAEWAEIISQVGDSDQPGVHVAALMRALEPLGVRFTAIDESVEGHRIDEAIVVLTAPQTAAGR